VDDEVLVAFDNGQIDHPYVIGFLYNGSQNPPETELKNRVILTPGGNTLRFEDKDGDKKVILKTEAGFVLEMDENNKKITLSDAGSEIITITSQDSKIKIEAGAKVVINAPQIELEENASHPVVFGDILQNYLDNMMKVVFDAHMHPGEMALGIFPITPAPPVPPMPPATTAINSVQVKTG
jgi:phage baseplate assembly protein gpV